jgi:hypothetical protein
METKKQDGAPMNPWEALKIKKGHSADTEYVLAADKALVSKMAASVQEEQRLHLDLYPEPFTGNPAAPIYLLNLNPGYHAQDKADMALIHQYALANLKHESKGDYPFYFLNPALKETEGYKWWRKKLNGLIQAVAQKNTIDAEEAAKKVAQSIFCIEYFPYHSKTFYPTLDAKIPSQDYTATLIGQAMKRKNVLFIILRSKQKFYAAFPKLETRDLVFSCNSPQNPAISPNNVPDGVFDKILERIK